MSDDMLEGLDSEATSEGYFLLSFRSLPGIRNSHIPFEMKFMI